jgi:hypothetical protein
MIEKDYLNFEEIMRQNKKVNYLFFFPYKKIYLLIFKKKNS